jgi:hypothetical protein
VRWSRVFGECGARVAYRKGDELHPSPVCLEGHNEEGVIFCFFAILLSQPKSLKNAISRKMRVHCFLSTVVGSGEGVCGTPLA